MPPDLRDLRVVTPEDVRRRLLETMTSANVQWAEYRAGALDIDNIGLGIIDMWLKPDGTIEIRDNLPTVIEKMTVFLAEEVQALDSVQIL